MNNKIPLRLLALWQTLTEVPGWPDAPLGMRIRRALPVVIPIASVVLVAIWHFAVTLTSIRAERASFTGVLQLEQDLVALASVSTEEEAADFASRAAAAQKKLLGSPGEAAAVVGDVSALAQGLGWDWSLQALPVDPETASGGATHFYPIWVKGRGGPRAGNAEPFATLLAVTERLSEASKRIDLTRLAVRADDEGRQTVEVQLRLACRIQP